MVTLRVVVPEGVSFSDLKLHRSASGLKFDWAPLEAICEASGIDIALRKEEDESNAAGLIEQWYASHRALGGARDPVMEELLREVSLAGSVNPADEHPSADKLQ
jgi:hypothetical protein